VANLLCIIELIRGRALPVSLEVLGQGRRVATELGATLYAVVALPRAPSWSEDDLVAQLAAHGADKVVIATDETLDGSEDLRWGTHGTTLSAVCDLLSPSLLLFGMTPTGREVAARAAARMGAAFLANAWVEARDGKLALFEGSGAQGRGLDGELEFAVVATVPAGRYATAVGDEEAEVEVVATTGRPDDFEELAVEPDTGPRAVVVSGGARTRAAAARLATALGGVVVDVEPAGGKEPAQKAKGKRESGSGKTSVGKAKERSGKHPAKDTSGKHAAAKEAGTATAAGGAATARLAITLGPPCPAAERRVRLGGGNADADYAVDGEAAALATELTRALDGGA
jgi:electron transfer flavoprotein alpha subunit